MYGIDLGTTNSIIGKFNPETNEVEMTELVPSVVNLVSKDVGNKAKRQLIRYSREVTSRFKTQMPMNYAKASSYLVLKHLKELVGDTSDEVVVSVPAYFNTLQRDATVLAAKKAGYKEVLLVNEPTAAILSYGKLNKGLFLVYDLGGGTFDVSLVLVDKTYTVLETIGSAVGGNDLDSVILSRIMPQIKIDLGEEVDEAGESQLLALISELKIRLQKTGENQYLYYMGNKYIVTVNTYRQCVYNVFQQTLHMIDGIIRDYKKQEMNMILVGGSTRDPYLQEIIKDYIEYNELDIKIRPINYDQDTLVAKGAAYYAYLYEKGELNIVADICSSIGVEVADENGDGVIWNIIKNNSIIPTAGAIIVESEVGQDSVVFDIYKGQNDDDRPLESNKIGGIKWSIDNPTQRRIYQIEAGVSANGVVKITAKELGSLKREALEIC